MALSRPVQPAMGSSVSVRSLGGPAVGGVMDMPMTEATTELEQEAFGFQWTVKRFSGFGAEEIRSPVFRGGPRSQHQWQLKVCARRLVDQQEFFAIHLIFAGFGDGIAIPNRCVRARFQMTLMEGDGRVGKEAGGPAMTSLEFRRMTVWGYERFLLSSDLYSPLRRYIVNDCVKIQCRVWIDGEVKHEFLHTETAPGLPSLEDRSRVQESQLSRELGQLLQNSWGSDVTLTSGGGATFPAHKIILAARSSVFLAMFNTNMVEREGNSVSIPDFEAKVVKGMLEYIYTGKTDAIYDCAPDLLMIAEKYDLMELKEVCEREIVAHLCVENAAEVLVLAGIYNAGNLKVAAKNFFMQNKEAIKETETYKNAVKLHSRIFLELL